MKLMYPKYFTGTAAQNAPFQTLCLNNFKNHASAGGYAINGANLDDSDWAINSTASLM